MSITPEQAIDAVNDVFGRHAGYRALHAKGTLCKGTFTATAEGAAITTKLRTAATSWRVLRSNI